MKIDWKKIKKEYVSSKVSQRDLAKKHGISLSQVSRHCRAENWVEARKKYHQRVYRTAMKKQEKKDIDQLAKIKSSADRMGNIIDSMMEKTEALATSGRMDLGYAALIKSMTSAMKDLTAVIRDIYELPSLKEQTEIDIAWKRLELQQEQGEIAKARSGIGLDEGGESGVIMLAPVKEESEEESITIGEEGTDE